MYSYETQICVIAGGPSGLSAAVQAAEDGVSVIILEKASTIGGAANMGMGLLGIGTSYQKRDMQEISVETAFNMFMEYTHYNVDARLVKRYFEQSADTIEWLEDMGVEFEGAYRYFPKSQPTWHIVKTDQGIGPRAASVMNKALQKRAQELGVKILLETPAKKILKENGRVVGVMAEDKEGNEIRVNCDAAIICTGGAGCNLEMIRQETGYIHGKDMFNFAIPGLMGDGLRMAWEAGVHKLPVRIEQAASVLGIDGMSASVSNIMSQPNLLVNLQGKRFMNEDQMQNATFLSNAVSHQKERVGISIIDSSIAKYYMKRGVDNVNMVRSDPDVSDFSEAIQMAKEDPDCGLYIADSIEELAQMIGMDEETLVETVEEYNDYCDTVDEEFFKPKKYMRSIAKAPFYAAKIVPGLYAAGADACNLYDDSYMFLLPGNSMGFAVNSGRIAGMSAAEYVENM